MEAMKDYVAHLDNKKRITLTEEISAKTLADMDRAVSNFKKGDTSPTIDLSDF